MEFAIIIGLAVWIVASIPAALEKARIERQREEREEREYQRERELAEFLEEHGDPLKLLPGLRERN